MNEYMNPRTHFLVKERRSKCVSLSDVNLQGHVREVDAGGGRFLKMFSKEGAVVVQNANGFVWSF